MTVLILLFTAKLLFTPIEHVQPAKIEPPEAIGGHHSMEVEGWRFNDGKKFSLPPVKAEHISEIYYE